ncbi:MAG: leucine-rich repeat protein [Holosporaceae bacterium]|nr:leucine-rich repeat protein [Holosporaceae bacterium]
MKFITKVKNILLSLIFLFGMAEAKLSMSAFFNEDGVFCFWGKGVTPDMVGNMKQQYSLFWGRLMLSSNYLLQLRTNGNVTFGENENKRSYVNDKSKDVNDGVSNLIIKLFNNCGGMGHTLGANKDLYKEQSSDKQSSDKQLAPLAECLALVENYRTQKELVDPLDLSNANTWKTQYIALVEQELKKLMQSPEPKKVGAFFIANGLLNTNDDKRNNEKAGKICDSLISLKSSKKKKNLFENQLSATPSSLKEWIKNGFTEEVLNGIMSNDLEVFKTTYDNTPQETDDNIYKTIVRCLSKSLSALIGDLLEKAYNQQPTDDAKKRFLTKAFISKGFVDQTATSNTSITPSELIAALVSESEYGYVPYTLEGVVLAFIADRISPNQLAKFYESYKKSRTDLGLSTPINDASVNENVKKAAEILGKHFYTRWIYNDPSANRQCYMLTAEDCTKKEVSPQSKPPEFPDCQEATIRHIFASLLGTEKLDNIEEEINLIAKRVKEANTPAVANTEEAPLPGRLQQFKEFYTYAKGDSDNTDIAHRTMWNKVVSNLNPSSEDNIPVVYHRPKDKKTGYEQNELKPGFKNLIYTMAKVLGYEVAPISFSSQTDNVEIQKQLANELKRIFEIVNPDLEYRLKFTEYNIEKVDNNDDDAFGALEVEIYKKYNNTVVHTFTVKQQSVHGATIFHSTTTTASNMQNELQKSLESDPKLKEQIGYILSDANNFYHSLFSYEEEGTKDYGSIEQNQKLNQLFSQIKNFTTSSKTAAETSLENVTKGITEITTKIFNQAAFFKQTVDNVDFTKYPELKKLNISLTTIKDTLTLPKSLKTLTLSSVTEIGKLDFSQCSELKELTIDGGVEIADKSFGLPNSLETLTIQSNKIKSKIDLSQCPKLKNLNILWTLKDDKSKLPDLLKRLVIIGYKNNPIDDLDLSQCPQLERLSIERDATIKGTLTPPKSLETLSIGTFVKINTLDLSQCFNLKELEINGCVEIIGKSGLPNSLETLTIPSNKIKSKIDLSQCPKLKKLNILWTLKDDKSEFPKLLETLVIIGYKNTPIGDLDLLQCDNLKTLSISDWLEINGNWKLPQSLEKLTLPFGFRITAKGTIDLSKCTKLSQEQLDEVKKKCTGTTTLILPSSKP